VRYLLVSVPHRKPLNFTLDGLHQAQQSIDRLRNFRFRLAKESFPAGESPTLQNRAQEARQKFEAALDDNLNTAEALGAIFDMVRDGNTAMDRGEFHDADRGAFLATLERWDRIFAVLEDDDHAKLVKFGFVQERMDFVKLEADVKAPGDAGLVEERTGNGHHPAPLVGTLNDEEIERLIAERVAARRGGDYARSDEIRANLLKAGVILEDTKAGTRWKRK
jgi:cysteinyl-tRNA synthetase